MQLPEVGLKELGLFTAPITLKSKTEIENLLGVPVISYIPKFPDPTDELPIINNPTSMVAESFRALRTTLLLTKGAKSARIFMLTSSTASEGKTVFSANMAMAMQQQGKKVLLMEADFRRPRMEQIFGTDLRKGLSNYLLSGEDDFEEFIVKTPYGLDVFFAGPTPKNPTELLQSDKFDNLLTSILKNYEFIFISSTPASTLSDSRIIAATRDVATIFIVRAFSSNKKIAAAAVKDISNVGGKVAGVIVNGIDVPLKGHDEYSEYTSYYGSYSDGEF